MFFINSILLTTGILPEAASNWAKDIDFLFWLITIICTFGFILVEFVLIYFVFKYRRKKGEPDKITPNITHNKVLEIIWTIVPAVLMMVVFYYGVIYFIDMRTFPKQVYEIDITGRQWSWKFTYPNGVSGSTQSTCSKTEYKNQYDCERYYATWKQGQPMVLPINKKIKLRMTSVDVIHSFYVPAFRVKQDVVPGVISYLWFETTKKGVFDLFCTEYCGLDHSGMLGKVHVLSEDEFLLWLNKEQKKQESLQNVNLSTKEMIQLGADLFQKKACIACHALTGQRLVGPALNNLYGKTEKLDDGTTVKIEENYLRESILNPNAKIVEGYPRGGMAAQDVTPLEVNALVEFLKACTTEGCK